MKASLSDLDRVAGGLDTARIVREFMTQENKRKYDQASIRGLNGQG